MSVGQLNTMSKRTRNNTAKKKKNEIYTCHKQYKLRKSNRQIIQDMSSKKSNMT